MNVSVILPDYNGKSYLEEAVKSILAQTFRDFELIVIDDGSKDGSADVLKAFSDPRIKLFVQENKGLPATLNRALELAKGPFIARMDQDDVSLPERLQKQVDFLESHPEVAMVGCWADIIGLDGKVYGRHSHPANSEEINFHLLYNNPFVHSSVMFRREAVEEIGGYTTDKNRQPPEDYELFSRLSRRWKLANIPEVLQIYREIRGSMSRVGKNPFLPKVMLISRENLSAASGQKEDDEEVVLTAAFLNGAAGIRSPLTMIRVYNFVNRIMKKNLLKGNLVKLVIKSWIKCLVRR